MPFYTGQHEYYCSVDLHARTLYLCVLDQMGAIRLHKRLRRKARNDKTDSHRTAVLLRGGGFPIAFGDPTIRSPIEGDLDLAERYEIHHIGRFPSVQDFNSYCRLVKGEHRSAGKRTGSGGAKIGNAHRKWAFSEAAVLFRGNPRGQLHLERLQQKHGKGKALSILAARLGRSVYSMLKNQEGCGRAQRIPNQGLPNFRPGADRA